jgi:DNA adenine methylase
MQLSIFDDDKKMVQVTKIEKKSQKKNSEKLVRPFLRYPGSKFNASKFIQPFWESQEIEEYREPFLGSGAIFFKIPKSNFSWLNDYDQELINVFKIISNPATRNQLISLISEVTPSQEYFERLKISTPSTELDRAFKYFVINRTAYSGIMKQPNWGFHPVKSVQPIKWPQRVLEAGSKLENNVHITSTHFRDVISAPSTNKVWMFIDPPYFLADQKRAYFHYFNLDDHLELEQLLRKSNHKFCLTYDNCDPVKKLYSWANLHEIDWMYHTANSNVTTRKIGKELIITNY